MPYAHTSAAGRTIRNCEEVFRRVHWNNRGKKSIVWRCVCRLQNTGLFCDARTVLESTLEQVTVAAINDALSGRDDFLATLEKNITSVLQAKNDETLTEIDRWLVELQTQLVKLASSKADYEDVAEEIYRLREQKQKAQVENANRDELRKRMADMRAFLKEQSTNVAEYDEKLVRRLLEKVTVYEDMFTVEFKSGVRVDVICKLKRGIGTHMRKVLHFPWRSQYSVYCHPCKYLGLIPCRRPYSSDYFCDTILWIVSIFWRFSFDAIIA